MGTCQKCGETYDEAAEECRNCGTAVTWSPYGDLLQFADPAWVKALANGMGWILAGVVCYIAIIGIIILDEVSWSFNVHRPGHATWFFGIPGSNLPPLPGIPPMLMVLIG